MALRQSVQSILKHAFNKVFYNFKIEYFFTEKTNKQKKPLQNIYLRILYHKITINS